MKISAALLVLLLAGCGLQPRHIHAVETEKSFASATCDEMDARKTTLLAEITPLWGSHKAGNRQKIKVLLGEGNELNDELIRKGCRVVPFRLPRRKP
jgi:hypothetical protein